MKRERLENSSKSNKNSNNENIEIGILVTAKKMGLSFEELNLFSLQDYIDFVDSWVGEKEGGTRQATQADIDHFMG